MEKAAAGQAARRARPEGWAVAGSVVGLEAALVAVGSAAAGSVAVDSVAVGSAAADLVAGSVEAGSAVAA